MSNELTVQLQNENKSKFEKIIDWLSDNKWFPGTLSVLTAYGLYTGDIRIPERLPHTSRQFIILAIMSLLASYFPVKKFLIDKFFTIDRDIVFKANATDSKQIEAWATSQGNVQEELEIEGDPATWMNSFGERAYQFNGIDLSEQKATGTWMGGISDLELMSKKNAIKELRIRKSSLAKKGARIHGIVEDIGDEVRHMFVNKYLRDGIDVTEGEDLRKEIEANIEEMEDPAEVDSNEEEQKYSELKQLISQEIDVPENELGEGE